MPRTIHLTVNGHKHELAVEDNLTLASLLRHHLGLTGTKTGCEEGHCGSCTVLVNGSPLYSCLLLATAVDGQAITTIEGLAVDGKLHPLQQAFLDEEALQCGYCSPGIILNAKALLDKNPHPTEDEIRYSLSGNLCRCGLYQRIVRAVTNAAHSMAAKGAR
ncbi:MAG: ferredoxin [Dehalococcoidia bacterium]|nr:ferredoxin [Dehalococcoidia bacterium]